MAYIKPFRQGTKIPKAWRVKIKNSPVRDINLLETYSIMFTCSHVQLGSYYFLKAPKYTYSIEQECWLTFHSISFQRINGICFSLQKKQH